MAGFGVWVIARYSLKWLYSLKSPHCVFYGKFISKQMPFDNSWEVQYLRWMELNPNSYHMEGLSFLDHYPAAWS